MGEAAPKLHATRRSLDDLAAMTVAQLDTLYRRSTVPTSMQALNGDPVGRMLSIRYLDRGPIAGALRRFAGSDSFPWGGKSFHARAKSKGEGINRVNLGGRHKLFPFTTSIEASAIDGQPTIVLDYDKPENPGFIRSIHDELREVEPGLFLGPAMWKTDNGPAFVLWFAIDTR